MLARKYLSEKEWSMGNGQCPECCGVPPSWHGHSCFPNPEDIGHTSNCKLAQAIISTGGKVIFKNTLSKLPLGKRYRKGSVLYEYYNSPEYIAWEKRLDEEFDKRIFDFLQVDRMCDGRLDA